MIATAPIDTSSVTGYQLRLPTFEGPLDVLLRLIERSQLQITDVSLVAVTDQFVAYIETLDETQPNLIADFTNVATRLVLLKSRSLLPRPPAFDDEEATSDLARELIEYRAVKQAAHTLGERDRRGEGAFARARGSIAAPSSTNPPKLAAHEASWLARAIRRRLITIPSPRTILYTRPIVSLREMVERVLRSVADAPQASFGNLAQQCRDPHELRTAFLAVLVLIRRGSIDAEQADPFGEITMRRILTESQPLLSDGIAFSADD